MLHIASRQGDLILDFFAGSCALGQAVLQRSLKEAPGLRFIVVQLPEPCDPDSTAGQDGFENIAEIGKDRLRRVLDQITPFEPEAGFRAFKLSSSNIKPWDADFDSMEDDLVEAIDNIKSDRSEDDVLYELLLKYGLDLAIPTEKRAIEGRTVTVIGAGALVVCLSDDITLEVVSGIAALKAELNPEVMRVVFKDSGFEGDVAKTNAAQILRQAGIDDVKSL